VLQEWRDTAKVLADFISHGGEYEDEIAFCDIAPCRLVEVDRRFRDAYFLRHQGATSHETN
jgi:hypothetical protein